jgi:pyruvate ferredoxin oxidoreductase beta subunit/phenylglyoxylate dehydrogenase beta subunit
MGGVGVVGWKRTTGTRCPVFFPLLDNTASMLAGIRLGCERKGREVNVVAFAGDGASVDCGFQALSGAAERGERIIYICYDNEGYMNTGFQRSGSTAKGSWTSTTPVGPARGGKAQRKKDFPMIMAMHDLPYVATASPGFLADLVGKVRKAAEVRDGMAYIHVLNPCVNGWGFPPDRSLEVARLSVLTRYYPLFEVERGRFRLTRDVPKPRPLREFVGSLRKFAHLTEESVADMQAEAEMRWARLKALCGAAGGPDEGDGGKVGGG